MRAWAGTLAVVLALGVAAAPGSAILQGQEKGGDDYTGPFHKVS
jgi:hypothetical protein